MFFISAALLNSRVFQYLWVFSDHTYTGIVILQYTDMADTFICALMDRFVHVTQCPLFQVVGRLTVDIQCRVHITTYG